jgi:hypothetical protein
LRPRYPQSTKSFRTRGHKERSIPASKARPRRWRPAGGRYTVHPRKQGSPTPFAAEVLFGLLEAAHGGRLRLVITSNYPPEEAARRLGENAEAALSRVDWEVKVTGPDRRKARKGEGAFPF